MARAWVEDRNGHAAYQEAVAKAKAAGRKPPARWRVRWYDPSGKPKAKAAVRKVDADALAAKIEADLNERIYRDPAAGRVLLRDVAEAWLAVQSDQKRSTLALYRTMLDAHILPRWGDIRVGWISRDDVEAWLGALAGGPDKKRLTHSIMARIMDKCVPDRIAVNPVRAVKAPTASEGRKVFLTAEQVEALAEAAPADVSRVLILVLAYVGLRIGEALALKPRDVDLERRRIRIERTLIEGKGGLYEDTPKTGKSRTVPLPASVAAELEPLIAQCREPDSYIFTMPSGAPLRSDTWRRHHFAPAVVAAGLGGKGITPHSLRHTAASLAIAEGADIKVVQTMLGHAKATMTWDRYGHLFPDRLDEVAERLDKARAKARKQRKDREGLRPDEK